jgi:hypothetical protein
MSGGNATIGREFKAWSGITPTIHGSSLYGQITIQFVVDCNTRPRAVCRSVAISQHHTCRITEQSRPCKLFSDLVKAPLLHQRRSTVTQLEIAEDLSMWKVEREQRLTVHNTNGTKVFDMTLSQYHTPTVRIVKRDILV